MSTTAVRNTLAIVVMAAILALMALYTIPIAEAHDAGEKVTSEQILNQDIRSVDISHNGVGKSEVRNGAVGKGEIRTGAVAKAEVRSGAIGTVEIRDNAVTEDKLSEDVATKLNATGGGEDTNTPCVEGHQEVAMTVNIGGEGEPIESVGSATDGQLNVFVCVPNDSRAVPAPDSTTDDSTG